MRRRLSALLLVAAVSGAIAGTVSANQRDVATARIPALPRLQEIAANVTSTWRVLRGCR
jgi:hypothetical protein